MTATYESTLSNWVGPYVTDMLGKASTLSEQPYTAYTGPLTAGPSDLQTQGFTGIENLWQERNTDAFDPTTFTSDLSYSPDTFDPTAYGTDQFTYSGYGPTGQAELETWTNPANYTNYMSPYIDQALLPQLEEMRRQADISRLDDATRLTQAGAYGGSRQAIMESEARDNLARLMDEVYGGGLQTAYESGMKQFNDEENRRLDQFNKDRDVGMQQNQWENEFLLDRYNTDTDRWIDQFNTEENRRRDDFIDQIERARQQHNIEQGLDWQVTQGDRDYGLNLINDLMRTGQAQRDIGSEGIAADIAQFENERDYPYRMLQFMQSMLQGMPVQTNEYTTMQPSAWNETLATTGGLWELINDILGGGDDDGGGD